MSTHNPNDNPLVRRIERLEQLLQANPLRSTSVERGLTEFYDQSTLRITDSNLEVIGEALIVGWLRVVGKIVLEGLGILEVNGLIDLLGLMKVRGGGGITVEDGGDIDVDGGEIKAGDVVIKDGRVYIKGMVLDPTTDGGAVLFPNGAKLFSNLLAMGLQNGSGAVSLGALATTLAYGSNYISAGATGITMAGVRTVPNGNGLWKLGLTDAGELVKYPATAT